MKYRLHVCSGYSSALLWQKEACDKSDIFLKGDKCDCHFHWRQWNIMSYLTYISLSRMRVYAYSFHDLFNIRHIRKHLNLESAEKIIHAFDTSRLDYCYSLFFGLPDSQLGKLQRVQNACARLVCNSPRYSHCTPLLSELHWLPIKQRIIFKTLFITWKAKQL